MSSFTTSSSADEFSPLQPIFPNLSTSEEMSVLIARIAELNRAKTMEPSIASCEVFGQDGYGMNDDQFSLEEEEGKEQQEDRKTPTKDVSEDHLKAILERIGEMEKQQQQQTKAGEKNRLQLENVQKKLFEKISELEKQQKEQSKATADQFSKILEKITELEKEQKQKKKAFFYFGQNYWDANACHENLEIIGNKSLTVHYEAAKHSIPCSESAGIFYFEMKIINVKNLCSIGFATKAMPLDERISQNSDSCAYQSDGQFWANGSNSIGNANFSRGDFVGCGINLATRRIIFTKNGRPLDTSDLFLSTPFDFPLFPFISLNDSGDLIETNFGPQFKFDPAKIMLNFPRQNYWDANACHENLQISDNKSLTVLHKGTNSGWCSVFAEHPILLNNNFSDIFYYEISIKKVEYSDVRLGFAVKQQKYFDETVVYGISYSYASDGWVSIAGTKIERNEEYGLGDTVGIGISSATRHVIFTKNGTCLAFKRLTDLIVDPTYGNSFHPFVSLCDSGDQIEANFGPNFKFDLASL